MLWCLRLKLADLSLATEGGSTPENHHHPDRLTSVGRTVQLSGKKDSFHCLKVGRLFLPELREIRPQTLSQEYHQLALQFRNEAEQVLHLLTRMMYLVCHYSGSERKKMLLIVVEIQYRYWSLRRHRLRGY
jgi:hypothetical protein